MCPGWTLRSCRKRWDSTGKVILPGGGGGGVRGGRCVVVR